MSHDVTTSTIPETPLDIFNQFATNTAHEEEGRPFDKEFGADVTFVIARAGNRTYSRMLQAQVDAHKHTLDQKATEEQKLASEDRSEKIMIDVMAKSILLGWSGNVKYQGKPLPYSVDNAIMLLQLKEFRKKVDGLSNDFKNFRLISEEEDAKKSATTSNGASHGAPVSSISKG